jgi:hypothetical protein
VNAATKKKQVTQRKPKPIKLTPSQLTALDHLVGMGGQAYAGNGMFRAATAGPLLRAKCIEVIPGGVSILFRKYGITEHGRCERAKAHEKRADK